MYITKIPQKADSITSTFIKLQCVNLLPSNHVNFILKHSYKCQPNNTDNC